MPKILTVLTDDYADWECGLLHGSGRSYLGLEIETASPGGRAVRSMGGLLTTTDRDLAGATPDGFDALVVCGGMIWTTPAAPDLSDLLKAALGAGRTVACICGATLALARAGLLDDRRHTSNSADFLRTNAPAYAGQALYDPGPRAVSDRGVVTAAGTAPVSFAVEVFRAVLPDRQEETAAFAAMLGGEHRPPA